MITGRSPSPYLRLRWRIFAFAIALFAGLTLFLALFLASLGPGLASNAPLARFVGYQLYEAHTQSGEAGIHAQLERLPEQFQSGVALYGRGGTYLGGTKIRPELPSNLLELSSPDGLFVEEGHPNRLAVPIYDNQVLLAYAVFHPGPYPAPWWHHALYWAIAAMVVIIASAWFARRLARPLETLSAAASAFGQGELGARVLPTQVSHSRESAHLFASFDEMAERIVGFVDSREELFANISHELRTPLSRMRFAAALARQGEHAALDELETDVAELDGLVEQILSLARVHFLDQSSAPLTQRITPEPFELDELLTPLLRRFRRTRPRRPVLNTAEGETPCLLLDRDLTSRAIENLLDNADKYSPEGEPVEVYVRVKAGFLEVDVRDRGEGIDEEERRQLTTPFFRGAKARASGRPGHGVGLALVDRVARAHGGSLEFLDAPGGGMLARLRMRHRVGAAT